MKYSQFIYDDKPSQYENKLRPTSFDEFIGNPELVEKLKIAIDAAQKRNESICHILLSGPPGTGKTSISNIIAKEFSQEPIIITAASIESIADLIQVINDVPDKGILFLDECHALNPKIEEQLYSVLEDFKISIKSGIIRKTIASIPVNKFCLIGATTKLGVISNPLRDRFGIIHTMSFYKNEDIVKILAQNIKKLQINLESESTLSPIADRARGVPRIALRLLGRIRDYADSKNGGTITKDIVEKAMSIENIDKLGLTMLDKNYLSILLKTFEGGPAGVNAIAASLNEDVQTLSGTIEPFLLRIGMIIRAPRGRQLTQKGLEYSKNHGY